MRKTCLCQSLYAKFWRQEEMKKKENLMAAISKSDKLLVIVESPSKAKHIKKFLHEAGYSNANVLASVGHIMHLADDRKSYKNSGVYVENNFELNLKISDDKAKVMAALKDGVK